MEWISLIANWFGENEAVLSGLVAFVALVGLLLSPFGNTLKSLLFGTRGKPKQATIPDSPAREAGKPALFIEPFTSSSNEESSFAHQINDEVRRAVANFTGSVLVTDVALADYIARANVVLNESRCRVTIRLQDQDSNEDFWSARFEINMGDRLEAIDQLSSQLSGALRIELRKRFALRNDTDFETKLSKLTVVICSVDEKVWDGGTVIVDELLTEQPEHAMLQGMCGCFLQRELLIGYGPPGQEQLTKIENTIQKSLDLNRHSDFGHWVMGFFLLYGRLDHAGAKRNFRRSMEINPFYELSQMYLGQLEVYGGDTSKGIELCKNKLSIAESDVSTCQTMQAIAAGELKLGNYDKATEWAERAFHQFGNVTPTQIALASAAGLAGNEQAANQAVRSLKEKHPEITIDGMRRWPYKDDVDWELFVSGLRKAGLT